MMNHLVKVFNEILYLGAVSTLLIVMILMIKRVFSKVLSPKWHYYIWILLVIRLLIPIIPESSFSALNLYYFTVDQLNLQVGGIGELSSDNGNKDNFVNSTVNNALVNKPNTHPSSIGATSNIKNMEQSSQQKQSSWMNFLAYAWLCGMIAFTIYIVFINIIFYFKVRRNYRPYKNLRINDILDECKHIMGIKGNISLITTKNPRTPSLYTSFHTRILVSDLYLEQLSNQEIKYIFLHELAHYKRKDIIVNWLLTILQIIYFFNPIIWYAISKMHEDCEIACDAEALKHLKEEEYQGYGSTVIKLIRLFSESNFIPVTAGLWKHKSNYKRRIIMISKFKKQKWTYTILTIILMLTVSLIGLTGCIKPEAKASSSLDGKVKNVEATVTPTPSPVITKTPIDRGESNSNNTLNLVITKKPDQKNPLVDHNNDSFYGTWIINKVIAYGSVGTYAKEDVEKMIGKSLRFSKESATCFGDNPDYLNETVLKPRYDIANIKSDDFLGKYRMTFERLGVKTPSVTEVIASDKAGNGCTFLVKDDNTLILIGGGTYFELVRKSS